MSTRKGLIFTFVLNSNNPLRTARSVIYNHISSRQACSKGGPAVLSSPPLPPPPPRKAVLGMRSLCQELCSQRICPSSLLILIICTLFPGNLARGLSILLLFLRNQLLTSLAFSINLVLKFLDIYSLLFFPSTCFGFILLFFF
ncbi:KDM5C adjacent transcript [Callorhinus ursinus]|uniref:KDM5C adjacent transcript n=1 Tax=Callorhinus ursinus TaxID=34884 RepID=UPI003CCFFF5A